MKSESGALLAENSVLRKLENWDIANTRKAYSQNMANMANTSTNIYILTSPTLKMLLSLLFILFFPEQLVR